MGGPVKRWWGGWAKNRPLQNAVKHSQMFFIEGFVLFFGLTWLRGQFNSILCSAKRRGSRSKSRNRNRTCLAWPKIRARTRATRKRKSKKNNYPTKYATNKQNEVTATRESNRTDVHCYFKKSNTTNRLPQHHPAHRLSPSLPTIQTILLSLRTPP